MERGNKPLPTCYGSSSPVSYPAGRGLGLCAGCPRVCPYFLILGMTFRDIFILFTFLCTCCKFPLTSEKSNKQFLHLRSERSPVCATRLLITTMGLSSTPSTIKNISVSAYSKGKKGKGFPYSIPSVGPGDDPGVQAVSLQVTV